jgi:hypothetical protein
MSKAVFLSHSSNDSELANSVVNLIRLGIGLDNSQIFCSSLTGYGVPTGVNFIDYIKIQIQEPTLIILLLTPSYLKSNFCLYEMGAAWAMTHNIFPVLVPPLNYSDLGPIFSTIKVSKIEEEEEYNQIRDDLCKRSNELNFKIQNNTMWDQARKDFKSKLPELLKNLVIPKEISIEQFSLLQSQFEKSQAELNESQQSNQSLRNYIKQLESLKNIDEVNMIKQELKITGTSEQFEAQVEQIKKQLQKITSEKEVSMCILSDYYRQSYRADHRANNRGFTSAEIDGYIQVDRDDSGKVQKIEVLWKTQEMTLLRKQLTELQKFLDDYENFEVLQSYTLDTYKTDFEPEVPRFWKKVYDL